MPGTKPPCCWPVPGACWPPAPACSGPPPTCRCSCSGTRCWDWATWAASSGEQARLSAYDKAKLDRSFGIYTMMVAVGQALAPLFMGALGGDAVHPDTTLLLVADLAGAVVVVATAFGMLRGRPPRQRGDRPPAATMAPPWPWNHASAGS